MSLLLLCCVSLVKIGAQTVQFTPVTDWHKSVENSAFICSVSDFYYENNPNLYWVEYNANRAYTYDYREENNFSLISNIYANVYDNTLSQSLFNYTITDNNYDATLQNTTSLPQNCRNPKTNDIITSYSIGYIRNSGERIIEKLPANNTISTRLSVYWKIFEMDKLQFTEEILAFDGLKSPYNNLNTSFNYNFNSKVICNEDYYLLSWYHWDQYQTYLQYRIIYKNSATNQYVQTPIISAMTTVLFNVSLLISAFGRTKTIQSKWDNTIFMGVYNHFDKYILVSQWFDQPVQYASTVNGIIGKVDTTKMDIDFKNPFVINQVTSASVVGYATGTWQSGYVKVEINPNNNNPGCCFVILYGQSWGVPGVPITNEVWGTCRLWMAVINDDGNHVIKNDEKIFDFENPLGLCNVYDPVFWLSSDGFIGNAQIIELDMLRTNTESYFMVALSTNYAFHSEIRGVVYKLYYDTGRKKYHLDRQRIQYEFISYPHLTFSVGRITLQVCFHVNSGSKQLFVGYTLKNVTDQNNKTLKNPLFTKIYDVSL